MKGLTWINFPQNAPTKSGNYPVVLDYQTGWVEAKYHEKSNQWYFIGGLNITQHVRYYFNLPDAPNIFLKEQG